ncbi:MAG: sugar transferase [Clostridia bacterium]|nr:sugar transferase [Clostridia bacterium]
MPNNNNRETSAADTAALREELERLSRRERRGYRCAKRIFDILFSAAALLCLSPVLLFLAVLIFLDDPHGSPIYVQTRIGRDGKPFRLYKFRSMVVNADRMRPDLWEKNEAAGPVFKIRDDPRVTRIGKFIRRTSIDELPQFLNVLRGDMSVVGPRPALPDEVERYSDYHRLRLLVTPGLTCIWQTCDHRNDIAFDAWVEMDIRYIRERNFPLDLKLVFRTVKVMFTGEGI